MPRQSRPTQATASPPPRARADTASFLPPPVQSRGLEKPAVVSCWPVYWALMRDATRRKLSQIGSAGIARRHRIRSDGGYRLFLMTWLSRGPHREAVASPRSANVHNPEPPLTILHGPP